MSATFDPAAYKATTREQWQQAAEPWHRWGPTLEAWLGEATETMLDMAAVGAGARVLDVAAGAGGQTLAAARRVGPDGAVLATDIAPAHPRLRRARGARRRPDQRRRARDGREALDVEPGTFDAAISALGLIYFPDLPPRSPACAARWPGGRLAAIVYSTPDRNGFFSSRCPSSAAARGSARRAPASRGRSASAPPA